jgi:hypothetical protein
MTTKLVLGSLVLVGMLQGCTSTPTAQDFYPLRQHRTAAATQAQANECPPLFGKVCYGSVPGAMKCGCSTVSPLGTPYQ